MTAITYEPLCGSSITEVAREMHALADQHNTPVTATFNGITLTADPWTVTFPVAVLYQERMAKR